MRAVQCDQNGGGIILTGYVPDEDLPALYSGALLFLFTTLYEGFGLPILEALACGSPVLTSNISSMREIASEATWRVDPLSHEKIAEKMIDLINGKNDLKLKLRQPLPDWKEMAKQTLSLYGSL
jgi:glycosyltransferase involved in cell wall biosynthesis